MSKRTKWVLLIGVIIALAAIYFLSFTNVEIESSKGQWRAVFTKYNCHDSYWDGYLIYNGDKEVQNISTSLTYNGEKITSTKGNLQSNPGLTLREQILIGERANKEVFYPIIYFADSPKEVDIFISWTEDGVSYNDQIKEII